MIVEAAEFASIGYTKLQECSSLVTSYTRIVGFLQSVDGRKDENRREKSEVNILKLMGGKNEKARRGDFT